MAPPPPPSPQPSPSSAAASSSDSSSSSLPPIPLSTIAPSSSSSSNVMNYLWIPLLIAFFKELTGSASANSTASPLLLLPSQADAFFEDPRCPPVSPKLNFRPVIGILSHPGDGNSGRFCNATNASYIAASYVKFVESAGARVIPLIYNEPTEVLYQKLSLVNGVIFTGGWAKKGLYFKVVESIFKSIMRKNDAGDCFPLLAICLGFELVTMIVSEDKNILEKFNATDQASTLQFTNIKNKNGTVFQRFPPALIKKLSSDCLVMQNHRYGISPKKFNKSQSLRSFFEILTTSADQDDKVYVSTMRAREYPVTAVQWHPEKNAFEWGKPMIPHSEDAIQVTQHVANFIVSEARMSKNRPPAREVLDNLIYNYSPTYCGKNGRGFDEVYIFQQLSPGL